MRQPFFLVQHGKKHLKFTLDRVRKRQYIIRRWPGPPEDCHELGEVVAVQADGLVYQRFTLDWVR